MHNQRLIRLLADNRGLAGRRFEVVSQQAKADGEVPDAVDVFLYDAIVDSDLEAEYWGGVSPQSFVKQLRDITAGTINLRINSPGGSVFGARAIETALREHKARVVVHIDGLAASAATFIAMAGDEIVMSPGAMFMIHNAWTMTWGNADELRATADLLGKIDATLVQTYAQRTGQKAEQIAAWMGAETWFDAEEAVAHGFADRQAETESSSKAKNGLTWNLNAFLAQVSRPKDAAPAAPADEPVHETFATPEHRERQQQRLRLARALIA